MVDNRSAGFFGIGGSFNFKSGDSSGMANKMSDDKMGQGGEYFAQEQSAGEEEKKENIFVDRSAQLRNTLDSLAVLNAARINKLNIDKKEREYDKKEDKKKKSQKELTHLIDDYEKNN